MQLMIQGIEHVAIASPDPQKLARWYVEHLNFTINFVSPAGKPVFLKAPDGNMIEIIEADQSAAPPFNMKAPGLRHVALTVGDVEAAYRALKDGGVTFLTEPVTVSGTHIAFFTDPEGNILHITHREVPLP